MTESNGASWEASVRSQVTAPSSRGNGVQLVFFLHVANKHVLHVQCQWYRMSRYSLKRYSFFLLSVGVVNCFLNEQHSDVPVVCVKSENKRLKQGPKIPIELWKVFFHPLSQKKTTSLFTQEIYKSCPKASYAVKKTHCIVMVTLELLTCAFFCFDNDDLLEIRCCEVIILLLAVNCIRDKWWLLIIEIEMWIAL